MYGTPEIIACLRKPQIAARHQGVEAAFGFKLFYLFSFVSLE